MEKRKILEMRGITKTFPGVKALDDVTFDVTEGEIHCLVGENGAGKSTLMKVLSGVYPYGEYSGDIVFDGSVRKFRQVRDSERTTATEVRATAAELESTLGGAFSVLASEFQTPLITLILQEMQPEVLKFTVPSVTTGISAISRERDYQNLNTMLQAVAQLGPEVIAQYLNVPAYLSQIATSLGMDPAAIVKSPEQIQQEQAAQQQAMQQQQMQETAGQMAVDNNKQQGGGQ